jgi:hypothetical protein
MAAPKGNQNARKAKDWERALRSALEFYQDDDVPKGQALARAAQKVVKAAVAGDWDAIEHIANRLDGKPTEYHETTHRTAASELSDDELESIATGRSEGAVEPQASETDASSVH